MKVLVFLGLVALAAGSALKDGSNLTSYSVGKEPMVNLDVKVKEMCILKLLNHILQPTMYEDVKEIAKEYSLEQNADKYLKADVLKQFMETYNMGMLPRGEVFVHTNEVQLDQAIKVFRILYFAKDFDTFIRTACWLRERINGGMFVYALTVAVFHRTDCAGITMPPPYEIYPYFYVDSHVLNKVFMMKMTKAANDPMLMNYYGIKVTDKNLVIVDWRKGVRHTVSEDDKLAYFIEDIDLNTYAYYLHINYPFWMNDETYGLSKERRGEVLMYATQQLLAIYRMVRLSQNKCDIAMVNFNQMMQPGYWPKLRLHTGDEMPMRQNSAVNVNEQNFKVKMMFDDVENMIRQGIMTGKIERRDGTVLSLKKPEDFETLSRLILGGVNMSNDDAKTIQLTNLLTKMFSYSQYNNNKYTYIPTAMDTYQTCLRDPLFWKIMKRVADCGVLFKKMLPKYTKDELDFPGVKVEKVSTDELVTFMDEYDLDVTNAVYLDQAELQKKQSDYVYVARMRRVNHQPFKVTIDVMSDKAVDAIVRIFIGPKYDCMGRLLSINDKRLDMIEMDSFKYKLETGKNTIVRNSLEMTGVIEQRPWTSSFFRLDKDMYSSMTTGMKGVESYWYKSRTGFPHRLLLGMGSEVGLPQQMYVIISPVKTGMLMPNIEMSQMKERHACLWTTCLDTMPLGYPFDREIDMSYFYTNNMKFTDVSVYMKDKSNMSNASKKVDTSDYVMKKDDYTYLEGDMLMKWSYKDVMTMGSDNMMAKM